MRQQATVPNQELSRLSRSVVQALRSVQAVKGALYHVIVRGNHRRDIFRAESDRFAYLERRSLKILNCVPRVVFSVGHNLSAAVAGCQRCFANLTGISNNRSLSVLAH